MRSQLSALTSLVTSYYFFFLLFLCKLAVCRDADHVLLEVGGRKDVGAVSGLVLDKALEDGADGRLVDGKEEIGDDVGDHKEAEEGDVVALDLVVVEDRLHDDGGACGDKDLAEEEHEGGDGSHGGNTRRVVDNDARGILGRGAERGAVDGDLHKGIRGDELEEALEARKAALDAADGELGRGVVVDVLLQVLLDKLESDADREHDGDEHGSERDCAKMVEEHNACGRGERKDAVRDTEVVARDNEGDGGVHDAKDEEDCPRPAECPVHDRALELLVKVERAGAVVAHFDLTSRVEIHADVEAPDTY
eukprot:comp9352_c0_seq1/m.10793 comp9352_c0_seq1/g.10793  ORF comp9352_c0_seq1/g.10793 comp9352_c0_seq1/m.10793 type:complete len:307 (-) comp9352_c0_seq1:1196-2116(-)